MPRAKKDISKDLMFQKIMPSADIAGKRESEESEALSPDIDTDNDTFPNEAPAVAESAPVSDLSPAGVAPVSEAFSPLAQTVNQPTSARTSSPVTPSMAQQMVARTIAFSSDGEGYLINTMEKLVFDNLDTILSRFKCCKCDRCKKDIIALTLNALPPKYIVATKDKPPKQYHDPKAVTEVTTALVRAVIQVKKDPRH